MTSNHPKVWDVPYGPKVTFLFRYVTKLVLTLAAPQGGPKFPPPPPKSLSHDEQAGNIQDFELSRCISYSSIEHGWGFSSNPHVCEFRGVIFFGLYKLYRSWKFLFEDWKFPPMVNWCPFIFMESKPPGPKTKAPKLKLLKLLETWRLGERCFCLTSFYCFSKLSCGRNWRGVGT